MAAPQTLRLPAPLRADTRSARLILFVTVFIDLLGFGIVIPFLPLFAARLGVAAGGVGAVLAAYSATQFLFAPILGNLSDRVGRRPVLLCGLAGSAVGYALYGYAASFVWLLISRVVHGACAATVSTAQAYMADITPEDQRAHAMGLIGAAFGLGFVLGPAIGGLLGHSSLRVPAYFASGLAAANFAFALYSLPESLPADSSGRQTRSTRTGLPILPLTPMLRRLDLRRLLALAFLSTLVFAAFETTFALVAAARYGYKAQGVGGALAWAGIVQAAAQGYLVGRLARILGESRLVRLGMLALGLGLGPLASFSSTPSLLTLLGLAAAGYGFANPAIASLLSKLAGPSSKGEVLGLNQSALSLARIAGPLLGGVVYQCLSPAATYIGAGLVMLIGLIAARNIAEPQASEGFIGT
jgi:DHA1 family tetracycline resistance protein-like MFS transporter